MKRFLVFSLLALPIATISSHAQTANMQAAANDRLSFMDKINELEAALDANKLPEANSALATLQQMMASRVSYTQSKANAAAAGTGKKELQEQVGKQQGIATEVRQLATNLQQNKAEVKGKLKAFLRVY